METTTDVVPATSYENFPHKSFSKFDTVKITKLMTTVNTFNDQLQDVANSGETACILNETEVVELQEMCSILEKTNFYHSSTLTVNQRKVVIKMVLHWPEEVVFPALDLMRIMVLHPTGSTMLMTDTATTSILVQRILQIGTSECPSIPNATRMLSLRVIVNCLANSKVREFMSEDIIKVRSIQIMKLVI